MPGPHETNLPLGKAIPPGNPHAVSVSLPKWSDVEGWGSRDPHVIQAMTTGYPRFFVPRIVVTLASRLLEEFAGTQKDTPMLHKNGSIFCSLRHAVMCVEFLKRGLKTSDTLAFSVGWAGSISQVFPESSQFPETIQDQTAVFPPGKEDIFVVAFPEALAPEAKAFWQHTGFGISSRRATAWALSGPYRLTVIKEGARDWQLEDELQPHIERHFHSTRKRIAKHQSASGEVSVQEKDVILYPSGMAAVAEVATAIRVLSGGSKCAAAVFGFPYVDTWQVIQKVLAYDTTLYRPTQSDIDVLEAKLEEGQKIHALFTEFPGNPLLQSPDLERLHHLSRKYGFVLVVDDTIGTSVNINVLRSCDVICTSLTKMFSGECNVMGGSVVLSPASPFHEPLQAALVDSNKLNTWFPGDIAHMDWNAFGYESRTIQASANASAVAKQLRADPSTLEVYYPEGSSSQALYDKYRLPYRGYGFMLSIRFVSPTKAVAFFDALDVCKGPSLGTKFTLACPYTLLAHYNDLEWAASFGVVRDLVRISFGEEDLENWLLPRIRKALQAANGVN